MKKPNLTTYLIGAAVTVILAMTLPAHANPGSEKVAYLGVVVGPADETLRDQLKLPRGAGLCVVDVVAESPAAKSDVKANDVLEKLDDQLLFNSEQLSSLVRSREPGEKVVIELIRQGDRRKLDVVLGETDAQESPRPLIGLNEGPWRDLRLGNLFGRGFGEWLGGAKAPDGPWKPHAFLGVELGAVEPALAMQLGIDEGTGALVNMVIEDSPADKAGIEKHDVIVRIDDNDVKGPVDLSESIRKRKKDDKVKIELIRAGKTTEVQATLSEKAPLESGRFRDILKRYSLPLIPRMRVFKAHPDDSDFVIQLETDDGTGDKRLEHRFTFRSDKSADIQAPGVSMSGKIKPDASVREKRIIVIKTDKDVTTVRDEDGQRFVSVKDAQENVIFEGAINSEADLRKLPAEVRERLDRIKKEVEVEANKEVDKEVRELLIPHARLKAGAI